MAIERLVSAEEVAKNPRVILKKLLEKLEKKKILTAKDIKEIEGIVIKEEEK